MAKSLCKLTPAQLAEQQRFEAAMRGRMSLAYRYMEEASREYDSPYTAHAWTGWQMAKADAAGVKESQPQPQEEQRK